MDALVIGAGLFGSVITATLRKRGMSVGLVDDHRPLAGSPPAGCLLKQSWLSSFTRDQYTASLALLDELYGLQTLLFSTRPRLVQVPVNWVDPRKVLLRGEAVRARVTELVPEGAMLDAGSLMEAPVVIVAAGVWTPELRPLEGGTMEGRQGIAFLAPGAPGDAVISPWAPYKQLVTFDRGDGFWAQDGTSVNPRSWTLQKEKLSQERVERITGPDYNWTPLRGIRPLVRMDEKKPVYFKRHGNVFVATGGAKNGTMGAAWAALQIARELGL